MSYNRRSFLTKNALIAGSVLLAGKVNAAAAITKKLNTVNAASLGINIFHTSDLNGQLNPVEKQLGGLKNLYNNIREQSFESILLNAGSFLKAGNTAEEAEAFVDMMNTVGYHAATPGIAELSLGQEFLANLTGKMRFAMINCNYTFSNKQLQKNILPYIILKYGKHRIGVTAVGAEINIRGVEVADPVKKLNEVAALLKKDGCTRIICLAAVGTGHQQLNNILLAQLTSNIDLVIGNNPDTALPSATLLAKNNKGYDVLVTHAHSHALVVNHTSFSTAADTVSVTTAIPGNLKSNELAKQMHLFNNQLNNTI